MTTQPIGIFDSGLGGLTIWREINHLLPQETILYLADHKFLPYGDRSPRQIRHLTLRCLRYFQTQGVKLIVVACNTATVSGIDYYRKQLPMVPIVGVVPVIKPAVKKTKTGTIAILSTPKTARSLYQKRLIKKFAANKIVFSIGCQKIVDLVERGEVKGRRIETILKSYLQPLLDSDTDIIALGCSHFPFLKETIKNLVGRKIALLDSGPAVARHVVRILRHNHELNRVKNGHDRFYTTGEWKTVSRIANTLLGQNIQFEHLYV